MNILVLDTSSVYASCAVFKEENIVAERVQKNGLVHSKSVMTLVEGCLESAMLDISEIDVFGVVAGPGSFTGVRIGVCAIKGLAQALDKPVYAVNTLDCLKENITTEKYVCPILDARRGQVYTAVYKDGERVFDHTACPIEEVMAFLSDKESVFLGDGVDTFREKITDFLKEKASFAKKQHNYIRAASGVEEVLKALEEGRLISAAALDAIYLRIPQAEREYEKLH